MNKTDIEWADFTWNPVSGCTKVSSGCEHCYAETVANRFWGDRKFTDVQCHEDRLDAPMQRKTPARIFVNSMSDLFQEDVPLEFIDKVFDAMESSPQHTFMILTKRPFLMRKYMSLLRGELLPNVWLGVSVENQKTADDRIPMLIKTQAALRFISYEPALGPVDFKRWLDQGIDWIIAGGESGPKARPSDLDWFRSVRDQCKESGVSFFMKQVDKKIPIPDDLLIREYPTADRSLFKNCGQ